MSDSHCSLSNTSIMLLALAVRKVYPYAHWIGEGIRGKTFFCDFYLPDPIDVKMTEEAIRQSLRCQAEDWKEAASREMVLENALAYLKHHRGLFAESRLEQNPRELATVVEMGGEVLLGTAPFLSSLPSEAAVRLWKIMILPEITPLGEGWSAVRLTGYAVEDKAALSKVNDSLSEAQRSDHAVLGKQLNLFLPPSEKGNWIWLSQGAAWKKGLLDWLASSAAGEKIESSGNDFLEDAVICMEEALKQQPLLPLSYHQIIPVKEDPYPFDSAWGLYHSSLKTNITAYTFCSEGDILENLISSLQMIEKTYKMLGVEYYWAWRLPMPKGSLDPVIWKRKQQQVQKAIAECRLLGEAFRSDEGQPGPAVELRIRDNVGQDWTIASVASEAVDFPDLNQGFWNKAKKNGFAVSCIRIRVVESLEMLMGLLLELYAQGFPIGIAPEQLRIVPVTENEHCFSVETMRQAQQCGIRASIDEGRGSAKAKVQRARREKVPCIVIIGREQVEMKTVLPQDSTGDEEKHPVNRCEYLKGILKKIEASMQESAPQ